MLGLFSALVNIIKPVKPRIPVALIITYDFKRFLDLQLYLHKCYICGEDVRTLGIKIVVDDRASTPCESFYNWEDFDLAVTEMTKNHRHHD
jgi:hypothetical protein